MIHDYQQSAPDGNDLRVKRFSTPSSSTRGRPAGRLVVCPLAVPEGYRPGVCSRSIHSCSGALCEWVFDRFPNIKLIVGYMGERIPSYLYRFNKDTFFQVVPIKQNITAYFKKNIYQTTGNFATNLLKFHMGEIGLDRIMYSTDYPHSASWTMMFEI
ncbi:unnamed protein product [Cyclocybe aegerita]|uniref:Amidohydrolase-related domain-containing protein n=1 Tax=Cyclocybe aegerita TaxID=1973307 RepID=A0A8S0VUS9_CYCAE|nr:unnamed protein product [Cyclocybe aegerita]